MFIFYPRKAAENHPFTYIPRFFVVVVFFNSSGVKFKNQLCLFSTSSVQTGRIQV